MIGWLSGFLFNPAMAAGTAGVGIPILIHILSRRRFRKVRWAAMEFLLEAQRRNRRRVKIEQLILLALRCLAVFLIAMMIARPFVRPTAAAAILGAAPRTERLVILDDSYSMGYRPPSGGAAGATVFERATEAVAQIAGWIASEHVDDSLTLLLTSNPQAPSLALPSLSEENVRRLRDHLGTLSPFQRPARMSDAITAAADLIRRAPRQANTNVYVITDVQRRDWVLPVEAGKERPPSPLAALATLPDHKEHVQFTLVDVGADAPRNVLVADLRPAQPQAVAGVPARFEVAVVNHTPDPLTDVELTLAVASQALPPLIIPRIQPSQTIREPIEVTFPEDGSDFVRVGLAGAVAARDGLALDNTRVAAVQVAPAIRVLLVDGQPSNDPYRDEVYLLRTALRPAGRASSGMELTVVEEDDLEATELNGYHAVVLANAFRLGEAALRTLGEFVRGGGGLLIFVGDQVDADVYNQLIYRNGEGLLPVPLGEVVQAPAGGEAISLAEWDSSFPALRAFVDDLAEVLRQVRFYRFIALVDPTAGEAGPSPTLKGGASTETGGTTATKPADTTTRAARAPARVLARFSDPARSPAIVQRPFGTGSVVLLATTADQQWNDWASNFSFVPIMLELVQHVARPSDAPTQAAAGAPIVCSVDRTKYAATGRVRKPTYPAEPEIAVQAEPAGQERMAFTWEETERTGLYRFELSRSTGEPASFYSAVNPEPSEGDLARAAPAELEQALSEKPFRYIRDLSIFAGESAAARREMWWPLLVAAILVLMTEHSLAWWFGARRG